jgi:hypothetical protein
METYQRLKVGIDVGGFGTHPTIWKLIIFWCLTFGFKLSAFNKIA